MAHAAFPLDADISAFVTSTGITLPTGFVFTGYGAAAQREFERRTGRIPFLEDAVDVARNYDPPGPHSKLENYYYKGGEKILFLDAGLLSCTSVALGVTTDNPNGQSMDLTRQLRLMPANAVARSEPYEWIEFYFPVYGAPSSVVVTGKWGYCTAASGLPEDVWQCALRIGAGIAAKDILQGIFASPTELKVGNQTVTQNSFRDLGTAWEQFAERVVARYQLLRVGF